MTISNRPSAPSINFLNLDLDFFTDNIVFTPRWRVRRVSKQRYHPWSPEAVRDFLERQCGLNRAQRIPGRYGVHHDAVFDYWKELITASGRKLDIAHVDAHGDVSGLFDPGTSSFIPKSLLYLPVDARPAEIERQRRYLNLANYVSFAVACEWVEKIEFVTHPDWKYGSDPFPYYFKDKNPASGLLELRRYGCQDSSCSEPGVPYVFTPGTTFSGGGFMNAFLCQSPNYTPSTADALIPVFHEYIDFG